MSAYRPYPKTKPSGVEWLGDVPEGWEVQPLKFAANLLTRKSIGRRNAIGLENIESWSGRFIDTETEFEGEGVAVEAGDILFGKLRPYLAKALLVTEPSDAVGDFHAMRPQRGTYAQFLLYQILSKEFIVMVDGSTFGSKMPRASWEFVGKMPLPLPPLPEQHQIAAFLDRECGKLDVLQAKQERLIELLKEKRQALISHAVTKGLPGVASAKTGLDPTLPAEASAKAGAKLKPSGIEWLGDVPEHWITLKLGYVAKLQGGFAFKADEFGDEGIPVVRMKNLSRGKLDLEDVAKIPEASTNPSVALRPGDLLWGMSGSIGDTGSLGNYAVVSAEDLPVQLNQRVGRFLPDTSKLLNEFLCRAIQASSFYEQILLEVTGTAQFNVSSSQVESCYIALPPLAEQHAIVAHLDEKCGKIDQLKAKAERGIELLKERRSALISAAVTGKIDVRDA